ncbi:tomoregulin-1b isoform X1 [Brienomyrus brachyistius]|uniref:tomoregulin-1b isoform X1 n=1 Tax=Brienomyrus brachyistius TaxID=42636 RepID=UPI0020B228E8|nr:tomoregulin-1b isoform X1 [Brienomyrus brachyistius]
MLRSLVPARSAGLLTGCRHVGLMVFMVIALLPELRASHTRDRGNYTDFSEKKSDLRVCDDSTCRYGGTCSDDLRCICSFQCLKRHRPVCGSDGDTYRNDCYLRQATCKQQKHITQVSKGSCYHDNGSGSGDRGYDGSGADTSKKFTKCGECSYGAECDEDAEDVWCICNIDCSGHNENPVCGTDGNSYDNPCLVREASCLKQERIDVQTLGRCPGSGDEEDRMDTGIPNPCSESYGSFCVHGECEMKRNVVSCRCDSGYKGLQCDEAKDFSILYVVPSGQKFQYVLIAAIVGAVQIVVIVAIVTCITRKCPKNNRGRRQKKNTGHFISDNTSRIV